MKEQKGWRDTVKRGRGRIKEENFLSLPPSSKDERETRKIKHILFKSISHGFRLFAVERNNEMNTKRCKYKGTLGEKMTQKWKEREREREHLPSITGP